MCFPFFLKKFRDFIKEKFRSLVNVNTKNAVTATFQISLLTRLYECTSGRIEIDDVDIREINIHCLRRMIGIVQQEPVLFNGTIFDNIALGDGQITLERVESVCRMANAHDFVLKLEQVSR